MSFRPLFLIERKLVVQREPLEYQDLCLRSSGCESILYALLAVSHLVLLLHKGHLLEELLHAAVCDVLDHLCREVCSLLCADGLDDLAGLGSLLRSEPSLGSVGLDVVLAVNVCRVDAGLLEGGVNCLLDLLFLGLLNGNLLLVVKN